MNELLYGTDGYPIIDTTLNDVYFILHNWQNKKNNSTARYLCRAAHCAQTAIRLNRERTEHPDLFNSVNEPTKSTIYWNSKLTKRDLIELISALDNVMAVVDAHGNPLPFNRLVKAFETLFNIKLDYAYKERKAIECRSDGTISFVRLLLNEIE